MNTWHTSTLDNVTSNGSEGLRRGPFGGAVKKEIFVSDGFKVYEQKHAIHGDFEVGSYHIGEQDYHRLRSFAVEPGDLIVSCSGTLGRVAIVPPTAKPGIINQALLRIRPKVDLVFPRFFKMLLQTPELQARLFGSGGGSAIKNVRPLDEIRKVEFKLPPLAEQKRIAGILDAADALRAKRREALAQLDALLQATFLDMFGDPVTNPKGWKVRELGEVTERVTDGTHISPKWSESGIPFLFVSNISGRQIDFETEKFISEGEYDRLTARCPIEAGDVLYTTVGSYGNPARVREGMQRFAFQRHIAHIKPKRDAIDAQFLEVMLDSPVGRNQADRLARGIAQKTLNLRELKKFVVFVPPLSEQRHFGATADRVERLRDVARAHLAELDTLFASLQSRAFRGEL